MALAPSIAVLIPCLNEEAAIGQVVANFRAALPAATIYVYDNNSTDRTAEAAAAAGAVVRRERRPGKGNVVRRMFQDIEADLYVMVDGDDTYDASAAPAMIDALLADRLDMVVAKRVETHEAAYRAGHRLGNRVLTGLVRRLFGATVEDMLSGFRVFSRRFAKSFPSTSREFEIETELTVHAMQLRMAVAELPSNYKERPPGGASKLRTYRDGVRILLTIFNMIRSERPLLFFTVLAMLCWLAAGILAVPLVTEYWRTGLVPRFPTAVLCSGLAVTGVVGFATGAILDLVAHVRQEARLLAYLSLPAPGNDRKSGAPASHPATAVEPS